MGGGGNVILAAADLTGIASIIGAVAVLLGAVTSLVVAFAALRAAVGARAEIVAAVSQNTEAVTAKVDAVKYQVVAKVEAVHNEVTTLNGSTLAMLADADETRRVKAIPAADRTDAETEHVERVPEEPK